ncbi:transposase, partial [Burkholderia cenocepacia]|uniref:transposase n=1 Tax=Burkholderia cenocepacia TaxID=95486 RepID=UPI0020121ABD
LLMVDGLLFAGFRLRQSDSQLKPPPPSTSRLNSPYTTSDFSSDTQFFSASHPEARLFCTEAGVDPAGRVELRLIRVELASGESEVLLTSLLDRQAFPAEVFADLYHRRWGIETDYRRLKQTLCLDNFSGRSVTAVKQDFHAGQLLKNLALLMQHLLQPVIEQRHKGRKLRWKVNFTQGVSRLKNTLVDLLVRPGVQGLANVMELMANSLSAVRPGRSFPRQRMRLASRGCEGYKPTR